MTLRAHPQFIMVRCRCQRTLRARWEQVGTAIQCWDCGLLVPVEVPRHQARHLGAMVGSVADLLQGASGLRIVLAAVALTGALLVPKVGLALAGLLMIAGGLVYVALVGADEATDLEDSATLIQALRRPSPGRLALGVGLALGTILPLWVLGSGQGHPPHLTGLSLTLLALTWTLGPAAAVLLVAPRPASAPTLGPATGLPVIAPPAQPTPPTPLTTRSQVWGPIRRHPLALLGALLIVPLGLVVCESVLVGLASLARGLSLLVLDFLPTPDRLFVFRGYAFDGALEYHEVANAQILRDYGRALRQGYSFLGTIPPSFSTALRRDVEMSTSLWTPTTYLLLRIGATLLICLGLTLSCAVQARCLNALAHARQRGLA